VASGATASEISKSWIGNRTVSWMEEMGSGPDGKPRLERRTEEIAVADPDFLANELGLSSPTDGKPRIRALVVGHGDVAMLAWPVGRWKVRRPAEVPRGKQPHAAKP